MAFKEVSTTTSSMQYWPKKMAERKEGDEVTGTYKGKKELMNPDGSKRTVYILDNDGQGISVNGYANIDRAFSQIPEGSLVKIIFNGKKTNPKTGRSYNDFTVMVDDAAPASQETEFPDAF